MSELHCIGQWEGAAGHLKVRFGMIVESNFGILLDEHI